MIFLQISSNKTRMVENLVKFEKKLHAFRRHFYNKLNLHILCTYLIACSDVVEPIFRKASV